MIQEILREGLITPSHSPFSSLVLLVQKKMSLGTFMPIIEPSMPLLSRTTSLFQQWMNYWMSSVGPLIFRRLISNQVIIKFVQHQKILIKRFFRTFEGHYELLVMPFGLIKAPATFQATMNDLLRSFLRQFVLVFYDDILIYSKTLTNHLTEILKLLQEHKFYAK